MKSKSKRGRSLEMKKVEARKAIKLLEANGFREGDMIKWHGAGWRVYATDNATGYRFHDDSLAGAVDRVRASAFAFYDSTDAR